ncbi:potassium channel subfamily K member 1 [Platysternon megacephalum]|uniref:Potassium channel subfamily K member 1 n=1 Tax=Platysternon megacephalum TaxID=55544 RepID=A0A4D9DLU0_9SAUR|nr:potassium channel subfamily K member 1 [Platysternon megacephalum]
MAGWPLKVSYSAGVFAHSYLHTCYTAHPKGCHVPEHSVVCGRCTSSCQAHTSPVLGSLNAQSSSAPSKLSMHFSPAARGTGLPCTTSSYVPPGPRNHQPPERDSCAQRL